MMRRARSISAMVIPLLAALALAACSGSSRDAATPETGSTADTGATAAAAQRISPDLSFPADPAAPGPYAVGVTTRTFNRALADGSVRPLETYIWYPAAAGGAPADDSLQAMPEAAVASGGPFPLVIFSHGSGGNPRQSVFFTAHLASYGFVVAAPPHPGNTTTDCFPCDDALGMVNSAVNRPPDVRFVTDGLINLSGGGDSLLAGAVDGERVGISGHSFGAYTTLAVEADGPPFLAGLAMSAPAEPLQEPSIGRITLPTMIMSGDVDNVLPPDQQRAVFDNLTSSPVRYLLTLRGAGHMSFTDFCLPAFPGCRDGDMAPQEAQTLINRYGVAFLLEYVAGDGRYSAYLAAAASPGADVTLERAP